MKTILKFRKRQFVGVISLLLAIFVQNLSAAELIERRRDQFGTEFSYFIYPLAGDIPGLGAAAGVGATILNINDSDLDFTGFNVKGDFDASGYTFLDYHLIKNRLIFDFGYYDYDVAPVIYSRGIDSDKNEFILPKAQGNYLQSQLTLSYDQRHFETYIRYGVGSEKILEIRDKDGNAFDAVDTSKRDQSRTVIGAILDNTDDRLNPRKGYRLEAAVKGYSNDDPLVSDFLITDYNATAYIPTRRWDTLVFNLFRSDAHITHKVDASGQDLIDAGKGLGCAPDQIDCLATEEKRINQLLATNKYGIATPLGGTQRLRSFANNRYYAGHSIFYGIEYRLNLTEEYSPFNIYVAKGVRTGLQLAFFFEQGSVAERTGELFDTLKTSYGAGFRLVLSGVIIRADYSNGTEGDEFILFIDYPWSMFSVDS